MGIAIWELFEGVVGWFKCVGKEERGTLGRWGGSGGIAVGGLVKYARSYG